MTYDEVVAKYIRKMWLSLCFLLILLHLFSTLFKLL
jgi:hypothetical protein